MDIDYIKEFVILAEIGNFLEASEQMFMSQSSLSRHIKALEEGLGSSLFTRTTRKVALNEFGKTFLPFAKDISRIQYDYTAALQSKAKALRNTVTIGAIPTMAQYGITDLLATFQKSNPDFTINIIEADSTSLKDMLVDNQCDFAFIRESNLAQEEETDTFCKLLYTTDSIAAVIAKNHALAEQKSITLSEIQNENILLLDRNTLMYALCLTACLNSGFTPNVTFTGRRAENIISLASNGMGIALLTRRPAKFFSNNEVEIVDIYPRIQTNISLTYNRKHELSFSSKQFLDWFLETANISEVADRKP